MKDGDQSDEEKSGCIEHEKRANQEIGIAEENLKTREAVEADKNFDDAGDIFYRPITWPALRLAFFGRSVKWGGTLEQSLENGFAVIDRQTGADEHHCGN